MMVKLLAVVLAGSFAADDAKKADAKKDMDKLQGTWQFVTHEINGQPAPEDQVKMMTITFSGDKFTVKQGDQVIQAGTNKMNPGKKPKTVDATITEGQGQGTTMLGIYEFSGDTMKFCFDPMGKTRPTELKPKDGSGTMSGTIKKQGS